MSTEMMKIGQFKITPREKEAFELVAMGLDRGSAAYAMGIGRKTLNEKVEFATARNLEPGTTKKGTKMKIVTELVKNGAQIPDVPKEISLSPRKNEILDANLKGLSNTEIAQNLGISEDTVEGHLGIIYNQIGAENYLHAAAIIAAYIQKKLDEEQKEKDKSLPKDRNIWMLPTAKRTTTISQPLAGLPHALAKKLSVDLGRTVTVENMETALWLDAAKDTNRTGRLMNQFYDLKESEIRDLKL